MLGDICTKPVVTVGATATVQEAARLMRTKNVGAIVVLASDKPTGILTDRDLTVAVVADAKDPTKITVREVMHASPAVIQEDQGIADAVRMFSAKGVRRLPVVNKSGALVGIMALDDMMMLLGDEMAHVASALSRELGRPHTLTVT
jgi:CBS domain-containing protein